MQTQPNPIEADGRWWLAVDGRPDGPRTTTYVSAALQAGRLSPITPVCPEGGSEWRPLATWPALAALTAPSAVPSPPTYGAFPTVSKLPLHGGGDEHLLTNAALPPMANLICIYAILVVPLYWIFGMAMLFREDNPFLDGTGYYLAYAGNLLLTQLVTLALTVVLAVGGLRLRDLRISGERLVRLALCLGLAWVAIQWIVQITLLIMGGVAGVVEDTPYDPSFWDVIGLFVVTAALVWDVVSLVWLFRHHARLPLHP